MRNSLLQSLVFGTALCFVAGCGIIDMAYLPPAENTAQELFETANDEMREKNYIKAAELYTKLRDEYPFSPYTINAELALADAYFLDQEYRSAIDGYKDFESLHPRHEAVPYCLYQIGVAGLKDFRSIDRATTQLAESCEYFDRLMQMYPDSPYAKAAAGQKAQARKLMAEHELYIADMFWNMGKYGPAWQRYEYITKTYSDVKDISVHARKKSVAAYQQYRTEQSDETRSSQHGHWKDWFSWL